MAGYEDDFEELRARANSGGFLPYRKPKRPSMTSQMSVVSGEGYIGDTEETDANNTDVDNVFVDVVPSVQMSPTKRVEGNGSVWSSHHRRRQHCIDKYPSLSPPNSSPELPRELWGVIPQQQQQQVFKFDQQGVLSPLACRDKRSFQQDGDWILGQPRPRVSSVPSRTALRKTKSAATGAGTVPTSPTLTQLAARRQAFGSGENVHKVRAFAITTKGLVKGGDLLLTRSNPNLETSSSPTYKGCRMPARPNSLSSVQGSTGSALSLESNPEPHKVFMLGAGGVGKTTLIHKFIASGMSFESSFGE